MILLGSITLTSASLGAAVHNLKDKDIEWYRSEGRLESFQKVLNDYWDNSRRVESEAIVDLEKHIWLLNSGAAILLIGYLQTKNNVSCWQLYSACSFILGVVFLFILRCVKQSMLRPETLCHVP